MKTLTLATVITSMWQSPLIALLILISFVFAVDLYNRYLESKKITCVSINWSDWTYKDLQIQCKTLSIKANSKRYILINKLKEV